MFENLQNNLDKAIRTLKGQGRITVVRKRSPLILPSFGRCRRKLQGCQDRNRHHFARSYGSGNTYICKAG